MVEKRVTQAALLEANTRFYAAFRAGDLIAMSDLWAREAAVAAHHPASGPVSGRTAVLDSWRRILRSPPDVGCLVDSLLEDDQQGAVLCTERLGPISLRMVNVFCREDDGWRMTYHGPAPEPELRH